MRSPMINDHDIKWWKYKPFPGDRFKAGRGLWWQADTNWIKTPTFILFSEALSQVMILKNVWWQLLHVTVNEFQSFSHFLIHPLSWSRALKTCFWVFINLRLFPLVPILTLSELPFPWHGFVSVLTLWLLWPDSVVKSSPVSIFMAEPDKLQFYTSRVLDAL